MQCRSLLPQLRVFGIGLATQHLCPQAGDGGIAHVAAMKDVKVGQVLAVLPDSALWCVNACMDSDTRSGFLPGPSELAQLADTQHDSLDELYISCCLSVRCFTTPSCWFSSRVNAMRHTMEMSSVDASFHTGDGTVDESTIGRMRELWSRLAKTFATPPLPYWIAALHYVKVHALHRRPTSSASRSMTCVAPFLDCLIAPTVEGRRLGSRKGDEAVKSTLVSFSGPNTRLMSAYVKDVRELLQHEPMLAEIRGARQYLRGKDGKYPYWLVCAERDIQKGEVLSMPSTIVTGSENADVEPACTSPRD